jgi:hypothetical protein
MIVHAVPLSARQRNGDPAATSARHSPGWRVGVVAVKHLCDFAKAWHARDEAARQAWQEEAMGILYEQGGAALRAHLQALTLSPRTSAAVHEELRKLRGFFENNRHRTDYPTYRRNGWDIGSGPTEAGCKIIGERLKGSGMRWAEDGAATVAALRALRAVKSSANA